eukprot:TRINITY_DN9564_c0_g1_i3.p1 TRINITY_DN9564_c0_g1~~TRINITY_DN9564_c0_g1_i3.p1  ORF type:complete len:227 (+),score=47.18 TRINITY_DN9564_c0_g1_i3:124-804(+)
MCIRDRGGYMLAPRARPYRPPVIGLNTTKATHDTQGFLRAPLRRQDDALLRSAIAGEEVGVKAALRQGADVDCIDEVGHTASIKASRHANLKCLMALVAAKADLNKQDENGWTAAHWAAQGGSLLCMEELINPSTKSRTGCDLNVKSHAQLKPVHVAANSEVVAAIKIGLQKRLLAKETQAAEKDKDDVRLAALKIAWCLNLSDCCSLRTSACLRRARRTGEIRRS